MEGKSSFPQRRITTATAARRLGMTAAELLASIAAGVVQLPASRGGGTLLWTPAEVDAASWSLLGRAVEAFDRQRRQAVRS